MKPKTYILISFMIASSLMLNACQSNSTVSSQATTSSRVSNEYDEYSNETYGEESDLYSDEENEAEYDDSMEDVSTAISEEDLTERQLTILNLRPYLIYVGQAINANGDFYFPESGTYAGRFFYTGYVEILDRAGEVSFSVNNNNHRVQSLEWIEKVQSDEEEFEDFVLQLNDFFKEEGTTNNYKNLGYSDKVYIWPDYNYECIVLCWYQDKYIHIMWDYYEDLVLEKDEDLIFIEKCEATGALASEIGRKVAAESGNLDSYGTSSSWAEVTDDDERNICWSLSRDAVKSKLKAPSTAKFPFSYADSDVSITASGDTYKVISIVDSENDFGSSVRSRTTVTIEKNGSNFSVISCEIE